MGGEKGGTQTFRLKKKGGEEKVNRVWVGRESMRKNIQNISTQFVTIAASKTYEENIYPHRTRLFQQEKGECGWPFTQVEREGEEGLRVHTMMRERNAK